MAFGLRGAGVRPAQCSRHTRPAIALQRHSLQRCVLQRHIQSRATGSASFKDVYTEEAFINGLKQEVAAGRMPEMLLPLWMDFYNNYKAAVLSNEEATERLVVEVQCEIADCVIGQFVDPFTFPSYHERILSPFNYFEFGQKYTGSLINFKQSFLGHVERWNKINEQIQAGENVVLLANHQTEADPGVFAHMLMDTHPNLAQNVIYVAGDRVITDALCKPFSMGRNLFCVYSKRHMDDDPAKRAEKMATNRRTLRVMAEKLNQGGQLLWIAPAGGRDRTNDQDRYVPAKFDPSAVELMRKLLGAAKPAGHLYPMAMYSAPIMPPPKGIEKGLGERRVCGYSGVGMTVAEAVDVDAVLQGIEGKEERIAALSNNIYDAVCHEYEELDRAINDPEFAKSSGKFVQPWLKTPVAA